MFCPAAVITEPRYGTKCDFAKAMTLKGQGHWSMNGTVGNLDLENIHLDTNIIISSTSVQKLCSKTDFYKMVANTMHSHMSCLQTNQDVF